MGTCLAFVFGVLLEFTIVNYWARREARVKENRTKAEKKGKKGKDKGKLPSVLRNDDSPLLFPSYQMEVASPPRQGRCDACDKEFQLDCNSLLPLVQSTNGTVVWQKRTSSSRAEEASLIHRILASNPSDTKPRVSFSDPKSFYAENQRLKGLRMQRASSCGVLTEPFPKTRSVDKMKNRNMAQNIDQTCRYMFPLAFLAFNIAYWTYYALF